MDPHDHLMIFSEQLSVSIPLYSLALQVIESFLVM